MFYDKYFPGRPHSVEVFNQESKVLGRFLNSIRGFVAKEDGNSLLFFDAGIFAGLLGILHMREGNTSAAKLFIRLLDGINSTVAKGPSGNRKNIASEPASFIPSEVKIRDVIFDSSEFRALSCFKNDKDFIISNFDFLKLDFPEHVRSAIIPFVLKNGASLMPSKINFAGMLDALKEESEKSSPFLLFRPKTLNVLLPKNGDDFCGCQMSFLDDSLNKKDIHVNGREKSLQFVDYLKEIGGDKLLLSVDVSDWINKISDMLGDSDPHFKNRTKALTEICRELNIQEIRKTVKTDWQESFSQWLGQNIDAVYVSQDSPQ